MASVTSASPPSVHGFNRSDSADDSDSWQYVESNPSSSVGFIPSPASSSMHSWAIVGYPAQVQPSPTAMSPLHLDHEHSHGHPPPTSFPDQHADASSMMAGAGAENQLMSAYDEQQILGQQDFMFAEPLTNPMDFTQYYPSFHGDLPDMTGYEGLNMASQPVNISVPQQHQSHSDVAPWPQTSLKSDEFIAMEGFPGYSSHSPNQLSPTPSSDQSNPTSPHAKSESGKSVSPIRKVRGSGKIEKKRPESSKFVIMTPNLISQQSGKPNPFECFEAMRATQRGRKGPLANDTKESALQVRRLGACFCCHSRKVKCDKERPCKNCKKLTTQVPQVICWQFGDFLPVLFPDFIRGHFKKEQMASFLAEHVDSFKVDGTEQSCSVELFSGAKFSTTLTVPACFFTPRTAEILQHWHVTMGVNQMDLQSRGAVPIGIDPDNGSHRDELRKKARDYVTHLVSEPFLPEQVTDSVRSTQLPRRLLSIAQRYAQRTESPIVRRALGIYAMHYVLTRQLCLTHNSIMSLKHTNMVPQNTPWLTTRVLNRQVKAVLDELLLKDMQALFETFSKSLKPKSRKEWAPCLAAFMVLCLFMEAVETAADTFVVSQNELAARNRGPPTYRRGFALALTREIDNLPFKQFAFQFHQVYQTHTRDSAARAFNPLVDDELLTQPGLLDAPALEMVAALRELIQGESWHELEFLVADPVLPDEETHPHARDIKLDYTGRLLSRFLLSFTDERYLFDGQY
ncbi:hypothetical protein F4780DRAFT_724040 [Xylariomycetidae sp. FL0641]|nr:hypothetical protein F4780DRAFT_724040 [Xylariomycetidae sp. FL0641]